MSDFGGGESTIQKPDPHDTSAECINSGSLYQFTSSKQPGLEVSASRFGAERFKDSSDNLSLDNLKQLEYSALFADIADDIKQAVKSGDFSGIFEDAYSVSDDNFEDDTDGFESSDTNFGVSEIEMTGKPKVNSDSGSLLELWLPASLNTLQPPKQIDNSKSMIRLSQPNPAWMI